MNKKFEKNQEKSRRKILREEYEQLKPIDLKAWEEAMLENHSYYDIDYLEKANKKTGKESSQQVKDVTKKLNIAAIVLVLLPAMAVTNQVQIWQRML